MRPQPRIHSQRSTIQHWQLRDLVVAPRAYVLCDAATSLSLSARTASASAMQRRAKQRLPCATCPSRQRHSRLAQAIWLQADSAPSWLCASSKAPGLSLLIQDRASHCWRLNQQRNVNIEPWRRNQAAHLQQRRDRTPCLT